MVKHKYLCDNFKVHVQDLEKNIEISLSTIDIKQVHNFAGKTITHANPQLTIQLSYDAIRNQKGKEEC